MLIINEPEEIPIFVESPLFSEYLRGRVSNMLRSLGADSLEKYGSVMIIQEADDWKLSEDIGLNKALSEYPIEFAEILTFGRFVVIHACICLSNDFAIDVYCPDSLLTGAVRCEWLKNTAGGESDV